MCFYDNLIGVNGMGLVPFNNGACCTTLPKVLLLDYFKKSDFTIGFSVVFNFYIK